VISFSLDNGSIYRGRSSKNIAFVGAYPRFEVFIVLASSIITLELF
jgi:hypothetical protein